MKLNIDKKVPSTLYTYKKSKWAHKMADEGCIRIGTLHDFRRVEHGGLIGDANEGKRSVAIPGGSKGQVFSGTMGGIRFTNCFIQASHTAIRYGEDCPDCYIFCASRENNPKATDIKENDTCIEIFDLDLFYSSLTEALLSQGFIKENPIVMPCVYGIKDHVLSPNQFGTYRHFDHVPIWLQKDPIYTIQTEVRCRWIPTKRMIKPEIITAPGITKACKIITA